MNTHIPLIDVYSMNVHLILKLSQMGNCQFANQSESGRADDRLREKEETKRERELREREKKAKTQQHNKYA